MNRKSFLLMVLLAALTTIQSLGASGTMQFINTGLNYQYTAVSLSSGASQGLTNYAYMEWASYEPDFLYYRFGTGLFRLAVDGLLTGFKYGIPSYGVGNLFDMEFGWYTPLGLGIGFALGDVSTGGKPDVQVAGFYFSGALRYITQVELKVMTLVINANLMLGAYAKNGVKTELTAYDRLKVEVGIPIMGGILITPFFCQEYAKNEFSTLGGGVTLNFLFE